MDRSSDSGLDSSSGSDFTDSCSDSDIAEIARASSRKRKIGVGGNEIATQLCSLGESSKQHASNATWNPLLEPKVGMAFHSEDQAYNFYNEYAKRKGFSVRKGHVARRKDGSIQRRSFLCSNEGSRQKHQSRISRKPRAIERTNCMARIEYKVDHDNRWIVSRVILEHNHLLASPNKSHMLRSQRKVLHPQHGVTDGMDNDGGTPAAQALEFQSEEAFGVESVGVPIKFQSNCLSTKRMKDLSKGDTQILLNFLKAKQVEDPSFFYAIQLDDMDRLTNFFWADMRSASDYIYFGDVILLDTTYHLNNSDIPFASFIGINHHKQIVLFGAAVLLDETAESFAWLFRAFLAVMCGRQPKTILTDHCNALSEAIHVTLPNTCHRLCLWHISQYAEEHLSCVCKSKPNFFKEFKSCLYESRSEEDFHNGWQNLISRYDLLANSWLQDLFAVREKWALVYHRDSFSATMTTLQWNESMNSHFKMYVNRKLPLSSFLESYWKAVLQLREKELSEDYKSRHTRPVLLVDMPMLDEAANSYTRLMYIDFEAEFKSQIACLCEPVGTDGTSFTFKISLPNERCYWLVEFNPSNVIVTCTCRKFESMGILCMHALKVLNTNNILHLPAQYIVKRWTKFANEVDVDINDQEPLTLHYGRVCQKAISAAVKSLVSKGAMQTFEQGLDNLITEVENVLYNPPPKAPQVAETDNHKDELKGVGGRKRKRKCQANGNSAEQGAANDPSQSKGQTGGASVELMVKESSEIPPSHQMTGCTSFPFGSVIPAQMVRNSLMPLQGNLDHTSAFIGASNPNLGTGLGKGPVSVRIHYMTCETNSLSDQEDQPHNTPKVVVFRQHPHQTLNTAVPKQLSSNHKLKLDINKGN